MNAWKEVVLAGSWASSCDHLGGGVRTHIVAFFMHGPGHCSLVSSSCFTVSTDVTGWLAGGLIVFSVLLVGWVVIFIGFLVTWDIILD